MLLICAFLALASAAPRADVGPTVSFGSRIIGGDTTDIVHYPWQCSLRFDNVHSCGCVILSETRTLTAAHCTDGRLVSGFSVYAGSTSRTTGGVMSSASDITQHPDYNDGSCTFCNDVSILTTSTLSGTNIQAASLARPTSGSWAGQTCTITGWGRTGSSNILPTNLQRVDIDVISSADCSSRMSGVGTVSDAAHICVLGDGGQGSCNGDSGSPLNCGNIVTGLMSWVHSDVGNCVTTSPSVYARVSSYFDWIQDNMV